ncbi:MAG: ribosomal-protein-alanine N-acetyltransferase [Ruminococcaceae bacterium]|nr:ribosomal-protein-alanine N-acetyltransferase [Oscillospiraceae bacterium]
MSIVYERLMPSHIDGMEVIENLCFSEPWSRRSLEELLDCEYAVYFVAKDEESGTVAGYAGMYVSLDVGNINNVGVLPQFRRCGIGKRLMNELCSYCKNNSITLLTLEVRESNLPAIGLYESLGFENVGVRKNYYKKPSENGVLYNLEIK